MSFAFVFVFCFAQYSHLLVVACLYGHHGAQEVVELERVAAVPEEKVHSVRRVLDAHRVGVRRVLEDELLQQEERPLVVHVLPHLPRAA